MHVKIEIDLCGSKIVQTIDLIGVGKHNDDLLREFFCYDRKWNIDFF